MNGNGFVVAIVGAARALGRELRAVLEERQFPVEEWRLYEPEAGATELSGELDADIEPLTAADLEGVDVVFMCASPEVTREWAPRAQAANATVIDVTQAFAAEDHVPVIVPEVNAEVVGDAEGHTIYGSPPSAAIALAIVLRPLDEAASIKRVVATGFASVSGAGDAGIEELSRQTIELLNGQSVEVGTFPQRIAFNVLPLVGTPLADGVSSAERDAEQQLRRVLSLPELPLTLTSVRVPTFYGDAYAVNVETNEPIDAAQAHAVLREAPGILLMDDATGEAYPTLIDAVGQQATLVGRIRDDLSAPYALNLWVVIDGMRKGAAVNAVQIAELIFTPRSGD